MDQTQASDPTRQGTQRYVSVFKTNPNLQHYEVDPVDIQIGKIVRPTRPSHVVMPLGHKLQIIVVYCYLL